MFMSHGSEITSIHHQQPFRSFLLTKWQQLSAKANRTLLEKAWPVLKGRLRAIRAHHYSHTSEELYKKGEVIVAWTVNHWQDYKLSLEYTACQRWRLKHASKRLILVSCSLKSIWGKKIYCLTDHLHEDKCSRKAGGPKRFHFKIQEILQTIGPSLLFYCSYSKLRVRLSMQ